MALLNRRTLMIGTAVVAATSVSAMAQPTEIRGVIVFEGGLAIPKGSIEVILEDPAIPDSAQRSIATTEIDSGGRDRTLPFSLPVPDDVTVSPAMQLVARLERADGWLLARGSTPFDGGQSERVTVYEVIY